MVQLHQQSNANGQDLAHEGGSAFGQARELEERGMPIQRHRHDNPVGRIIAKELIDSVPLSV
jgi:hypothetical protein